MAFMVLVPEKSLITYAVNEIDNRQTLLGTHHILAKWVTIRFSFFPFSLCIVTFSL